jgi:hypothetical protein
LPLGQARATGSQGKSGSSGAVPFGAGIRPPEDVGNSSAAGDSRLRRTAVRGTSVQRASNAEPIAPAAVLRAASGQGSGGDGSTLALIGGGVAILILGGFGGVLMRRSQRVGHPG